MDKANQETERERERKVKNLTLKIKTIEIYIVLKRNIVVLDLRLGYLLRGLEEEKKLRNQN